LTNLKKLRLANGLSQQALAEKFNLSQQSIYKYENNLAEPDIDSLKKFAFFFGVSIDYLVGYTDENTETGADSFVLTPNEIELIMKLRKLNPNIQHPLVDLIRNL